MNNTPSKLSERLTELLKDKKREQKLGMMQQSEGMAMSYQALRNYARGRNACPDWALIEIAIYYGVSVDWLVGLTDTKKPYQK